MESKISRPRRKSPHRSGELQTAPAEQKQVKEMDKQEEVVVKIKKRTFSEIYQIIDSLECTAEKFRSIIEDIDPVEIERRKEERKFRREQDSMRLGRGGQPEI